MLQVRKISSSSGTYLCSMQGNVCGRWTLRVMFPLGYWVSYCEGYKQGSAWLRMKKIAYATIYNTKREPAKGSILQARE
jgi:hypothetical protein